MKRLLLAFSLLAGLALLTGCTLFYKAPVFLPPGGIFQHTLAPISTKFHHTPAAPAKTGAAAVTYIRLFYPMLSVSFMEDRTLQEAIKNGGITKLEYADYEVFNVLSLYTRFNVHAYGE